MRLNAKRMIVALAAVMLVGSISVSASPPPASPETSAYLSGRASTLLAEVQQQAAGLTRHAEILGTLSGQSQFSWQSHAFYLDKVKGHINEVGERTADLERMRSSVLPWQQQAITEVTAHAAQVAASTQAADRPSAREPGSPPGFRVPRALDDDRRPLRGHEADSGQVPRLRKDRAEAPTAEKRVGTAA